MTLIELLVVVLILGILVAVGIPQFAARQGKAFDARVRQDARSAAMAEEAYFFETGAYYGGDCTSMPGFAASPDVTCTASTAGLDFSIMTSHPRATQSCTWTSGSTPTLDCS